MEPLALAYLLTDFVVVKTIHHLRDNGYKGLALNFATMRAVLAGEAGDSLGTRIEHWLLKRMSASMQKAGSFTPPA